MKTKSRSIHEIIEEQMQRWQLMKTKKVKETQNVRIANVARAFNVSVEDAKRRIIRTESDRRAFIGKIF